MSNRDRKQELRAIRDAEARALAVAKLRHPHEHISYPGVGMPLVQLLKAPSFQKTVAWELRELENSVALFRSESQHADQYQLVGHVRLSFDPLALTEFVGSLRHLSLQVFPTVASFGIADGTRLEACFDVGFGTTFRACWIEGHAPAEWQELDRLITSMMARFEDPSTIETPLMA
jgi:hypothetical protein